MLINIIKDGVIIEREETEEERDQRLREQQEVPQDVDMIFPEKT